MEDRSGTIGDDPRLPRPEEGDTIDSLRADRDRLLEQLTELRQRHHRLRGEFNASVPLKVLQGWAEAECQLLTGEAEQQREAGQMPAYHESLGRAHAMATIIIRCHGEGWPHWTEGE